MKSHRYSKESLGMMVVFLLPSLKLKQRDRQGETLEDKIHNFLIKNFGGYTAASGNIFGYWKNKQGKEFYGEHKEYKVSFLDQTKIPQLENFIATIGKEMQEKSIYLETGEHSWLLYPEK